MRRLDGDDRDEHVSRQVAEDVPEDLLALPNPCFICRVGDVLLLAILVLGGDQLLQCRDGAVEVAI